MPATVLRKPFKTVCVDTVLFFAMFALVGHITINYWERYTIQNELYSMKHSLHILKETLGNIGKAYDSLHNELKVLVYAVDKKQVGDRDTPECRQKAKLEAKCKADNINRKYRDFEIQTGLTKPDKMKVGVEVQMDNNKKPHDRVHKATGSLAPSKNASTNTRNPPKSTGTPPSETLITEQDHVRHHKDFDNCKHVCHAIDATARKV